MKHADLIEALGIGLLAIALLCMVYGLWMVGGPAAWFGWGALLMLVSFVIIAAANRGTE